MVFSFFTLMFKRFYHIRIQIDSIPWASSDNKEIFFRYLLKICYAVYYSLSLTQPSIMNNYLPIITAILIILQMLVNLSKIMNVPCYCAKIDFMQSLVQNATLGLYLVIFLKSIGIVNDNHLTIFYVFIVPLLTFGCYHLFKVGWRTYVLSKATQGKLSFVIGYQYYTYLL